MARKSANFTKPEGEEEEAEEGIEEEVKIKEEDELFDAP